MQSRKRTLQECNRCLWQLQITLTQILNIISICNSVAVLLLDFEFKYSPMTNEYFSWMWNFFSTPDYNLGSFYRTFQTRMKSVLLYMCRKRKEKKIRDARRVFRAAVARTRNNRIPTSRLISKTNFRDVNETKSGARREFAGVFLVTARGWRSLWAGGFGKIEEWLYLQQV